MFLPQYEKPNLNSSQLLKCLVDFCFEFLMLSFVSRFHKKWKTKYSSLFFFIFMKELKNQLLKKTKINLMVIFTSMIYTLFKIKFVSKSSPCPCITGCNFHICFILIFNCHVKRTGRNRHGEVFSYGRSKSCS